MAHGRRFSLVNEASDSALSWRRLVLPNEHGSWAFVLEPLCLGLLVAFTSAGAWLSLGVACAFLTRRPLRVANGRSVQPSSLKQKALLVTAILATASLSALALAICRVGLRPLLPLLGAFPFTLYFFHQDIDGKTRTLPTELAGTGLCSLPLIALALIAGWTPSAACALALVNLARAWPTVLLVRTKLGKLRARQISISPAILAHLLAPAILSILVLSHGSPWRILPASLVLTLRAGFLLLSDRPRFSPRQLGFLEIFFGATYVGLLALAYRGWAL